MEYVNNRAHFFIIGKMHPCVEAAKITTPFVMMKNDNWILTNKKSLHWNSGKRVEIGYQWPRRRGFAKLNYEVES